MNFLYLDILETSPPTKKKERGVTVEMTHLKNLIMPKDFIINIADNVEYNNVIIRYYNRYKEENIPLHDILKSKMERVQECNRYWVMDTYEIQQVKDFKKTCLCKDKFCNNCKKVKQAQRMQKFTPLLKEHENELFHMCLTVPNCSSVDLRDNIKKQFKKFYVLNRYLKGEKKIKGLDFEHWRYKGCVRSLEVTFKKDSYHPHIHAVFVFGNRNITRKKEYENIFSRKFGVVENLFSFEEILIQKIWYLLNNDIRVTLKNINSIDSGYSVKFDKAKKEDYLEIFKYMTKATDEKNHVLTYENFKVLYVSLNGVRQIQGYGCLYNVKDIEIDALEVDKIYEPMIVDMKKIENPEVTMDRPRDLQNSTYTIISRKKLFQQLKEIEQGT